MHSSLIAVVLFIVTQAAAAQGVAPVPVANQARATAELVKKKGVSQAPAAAVQPGAEIIKTAAAGTHDDVVRVARSTPPTASSSDQESNRRGGPAMLLAALALMSGIALRRFGANRQ